MTNSILRFENDQFGELQGMNMDGEAWLVATVVARKLGYANPQKAIRDHVDDEDKRTERIVHPSGGTQQTLIINESGLYALILSSKLPQAREFKHWVTAVVLPQIRKTGGYIPVNAEDNEKTILCKAVTILQRTLQEKDNLLAAQQPKVDFANAVVGSVGSILIRDLAKVITQNGVKMGQSRLFYWLRKHGYLFQRETRPIQKWVEKGIFEISEGVYEGVIKVTTKVTGKGQEYFVNGFQSGKFNAGEGAFADISFK